MKFRVLWRLIDQALLYVIQNAFVLE